MIQVTEQQIAAWAPNPTAVTNARKISQKGGFVRLERSPDDTFYLGECTGSGKSNYITSADFIDPAAPVFRCTCPSRQFPCKHSLALLFEILAGKSFSVQEIPEDILQKRAKKAARETREDGGEKTARKSAPKKVNKAARAKKLQKQLEGLELTRQLVEELLTTGLGSMGGTALKTYRDLSKQLGDYYLPGPQRLLNRLILEIEGYQKDGEDRHYQTAGDVLEKLWALVKRSQKYLTEKLASGETGPDDSLLYEELGGVWKLDELEAQGLVRRDVLLSQLAFWVVRDDARKEYIDTGCWADVSSGEVYLTCNYRPFKALKYVRQEDTVFGSVLVPALACYPGDGNRRVRWDGAELVPLAPEALALLRGHAAPALSAAAKEAKNYLKNTMAAPTLCRLLRFGRIGKAGGELVLQDPQGDTVALGDAPGMEGTVHRLPQLPDPALLEDQTLLGAFWYDGAERRLKLQPLSIVTDTDVVRLLY